MLQVCRLWMKINKIGSTLPWGIEPDKNRNESLSVQTLWLRKKNRWRQDLDEHTAPKAMSSSQLIVRLCVVIRRRCSAQMPLMCAVTRIARSISTVGILRIDKTHSALKPHCSSIRWGAVCACCSVENYTRPDRTISTLLAALVFPEFDRESFAKETYVYS